MEPPPDRSRIARQLAEAALVRVVHHYGTRPEFVVLGGLVPEMLCSKSAYQHAGTVDIDVQVNLEIECGSVNAALLERALRNAEFEPDSERAWRWKAESAPANAVIKFELLADLADVPAGRIISFDGCQQLGAANLRGTGIAGRDTTVHRIQSRVGGMTQRAEVLVTGLAGFLLAKTAAAHKRQAPKVWYDIAFVLLHNNAGDSPAAAVAAAAQAVLSRFDDRLEAMQVALNDLKANFADISSQGPRAYAEQLQIDHPEIEAQTARADAVTAVGTFHKILFPLRHQG